MTYSLTYILLSFFPREYYHLQDATGNYHPHTGLRDGGVRDFAAMTRVRGSCGRPRKHPSFAEYSSTDGRWDGVSYDNYVDDEKVWGLGGMRR